MAALEEGEKSNLELMGEVPGNMCCCDCKSAAPEWASINLGVMMCLECSGIHRQLGTHISKVRSLKLDSKCWEGALLAHMCSIGNTAFNAVWEANLPADILLPQHHPDNSAVREAFVIAKYQDHSFFKNEATHPASATAPPVPTERFALGSSVVHEGDVIKVSGGKMFGGKKWDARQLKLNGGILSYHSKGVEKGRVEPSLAGCTATLCAEDEFPGHQNCFAVQKPVTGNDAKNDGRRYVFQAPSQKDAVKWLQQLRYSLSDGNPSPCTQKDAAAAAERLASGGGGAAASSAAVIAPPPEAVFGTTPGVPYCGLGQVVDSLYSNASQWVETSTVKSGAVKQLGLPNSFGVWHERFAVLTPWCLFVYPTPGQWDTPNCSIPLQAAELIDNIRLLPAGEPSNAIEGATRIGVSYPLGFCVLAFSSEEEAAAWGTSLKDAIKTAQEQTGTVAT